MERSELEELLYRIRIQPVFTAHPTEPTRRTILRKEQNIVRQMVNMLDPSMTPQELGAAEANIRSELTSSWQTEEHPSEHMAVADELEHVLFFLTDVLYRVIPAFYESIDAAIDITFGAEAGDSEAPSRAAHSCSICILGWRRYGWQPGGFSKDHQDNARPPTIV